MPSTQVANEDWSVLLSFLPVGWEAKAKETGALRRSRGFSDPQSLLRSLLVHLAEGCSLRETAVRVSSSGLAKVSDVALWKRLRSSQEWFRWLAAGLLDKMGIIRRSSDWAGGYRIRIVDATVVTEPGSTGTDWRLHYSVLLESLQCDFFELTDAHGGETFSRFPIKRGDLILGDRGYAKAPGVRYVAQSGGDLIVRLTISNMPLRTPKGAPFSLLSHLRRLRSGSIGDWDAKLDGGSDGDVHVRVCGIKKSRQATEEARKKMRRIASKKGQKPSRAALAAAGYVFVLTTVPRARIAARQILEIYRARWQIELAFKRMKSIIGLGHLPKFDPDSSRAWIHGKLFVALLAETLVDAPKSFFPWGYPLENEKEQPR
jgi:hypothetical protein